MYGKSGHQFSLLLQIVVFQAIQELAFGLLCSSIVSIFCWVSGYFFNKRGLQILALVFQLKFIARSYHNLSVKFQIDLFRLLEPFFFAGCLTLCICTRGRAKGGSQGQTTKTLGTYPSLHTFLHLFHTLWWGSLNSVAGPTFICDKEHVQDKIIFQKLYPPSKFFPLVVAMPV